MLEFNDKFNLKPLAAALAASLLSMSTWAADGAVKPSGFGLLSADGQSSINIYGQFHFDARSIRDGLGESADKDAASGADNFEIRRGRLGIAGTIAKDIEYEFITNTLGSSSNLIHRAYVNYGYKKSSQFRVGRFKQPFSLEEMSSANGIDFMERSYGDQLVPGHRLGLMMHGEPIKGFTYGVSAYQNGFNEVTNTNNVGKSSAARLTLNLAEIQNISNMILHVGLGSDQGRYTILPTVTSDTGAVASSTTRATVLSFRTENRGLANAYRAQLSGDQITPTFGGVANNAANVTNDLKGLEVALANGGFKFQAEYIKAAYSANATIRDYTPATSVALGTAALDVSADTHYYEFIYNLTGEPWASAYKSGVFGTIKPQSNFGMGSGGGWGAWQLAFRISDYKASIPITSGTRSNLETFGAGVGSAEDNTTRVDNSQGARTTTYGVNWILNPNARLMFNYARTEFDRPVQYLSTTGLGTTNKEDVLSLRWQMAL